MTLEHTVPSGIDAVFLPLFAAREARKWNIKDTFDHAPKTDAAFCVMANKKTLNRSLCLRLVEIFGFENYVYTWSGLGRSTDMSLIIQELQDLGEGTPITQQQKNQLLGPIEMPSHFVGNSLPLGDVKFVYDGNRKAWDQGLARIFQQSATALITESYVQQPAAVFTEKTVYAMLGCNFPIWIGGHNQAHHWKKIGFDIFDDVIDHSYQDHPTLIERCWYAMAKNREVLTDLDYAKFLRETHWQRLCQNRYLALANGLGSYIDQQAQDISDDYRSHVQHVIDLLR